MNRRTILIILAVLAAVFLIFLLWAISARKRTAEDNNDNSRLQQQINDQNSHLADPEIFPLHYGSGIPSQDDNYAATQSYVRRLQSALNTIFDASIQIDGQWGNETQNLINSLITSNPGTVSPDGTITPEQLAAIEQLAQSDNTPTARRQTRDNIINTAADIYLFPASILYRAASKVKNKVASWFS